MKIAPARAPGAPTPRAESAKDRRKRFWFDPRFAIGIALVIASVVGVAGLVGAADSSVPVVAARVTLSPGQRVHSSDLVVATMRVGDAQSHYLRASEVPSAGIIVTRSIAAGELVPRSSVGSTAALALTSIVVATTTPLPASVGPGSRVDVWSARAVDARTFAAPSVLVSSAIVVRVVEQKQLVAQPPGSSVELLVPRDDTAGVLEAIANGAAMSVVPVDLPLER